MKLTKEELIIVIRQNGDCHGVKCIEVSSCDKCILLDKRVFYKINFKIDYANQLKTIRLNRALELWEEYKFTQEDLFDAVV